MKNKKLAQEILQMAKLDQDARKSFTMVASSWKRVQEIDRINLVKLKKIVRRFGWPTITLVGKKASHMAWLLVQHADSNVRFQEYCLELRRKEVGRGRVAKSDIAYLMDRILVNKGMRQIYGTQFYEFKRKLIPREIKNPNELNTRRKEMGLEPFEDYEKKMIKPTKFTKISDKVQ